MHDGSEPFRPTRDLQERIVLESQRRDASEHRRRLMQGLGHPIVTCESHGYRIVAVGSEVRWSKAWRTFPDFLFDYIKLVLTPVWGNGELAKDEQRRHPLMLWYRKLCEFQQRHASAKRDEIYTATMTGAVKAYLGLAYDLYLCAHNATLHERLLKRLRNRDQFEGALYEAFVIGCFAKAGFEIEFEDEDDPETSHCEFTAINQQTGRRFSVEAKAVTTASKRSGDSTDPPKIRGHLAAALRKRAAHPRIVFIELSRAHRLGPDSAPEWAPHIVQQIETCEREITVEGQPAPPAYLFVTNRAFMHDLDSTACVDLWAAAGFKIEDFPPGRHCRTLLEMYRARERHVEIYWLFKALQTHQEIPTTFDDRLPEEAFGDATEAPLRIGNTYLVPDANGTDVAGVLVDASVHVPERRSHGVYRLHSGKHVICTVPLTDQEMAAYKRSPDTFFGVLKEIGKGIKSPLEAFDFVHTTYSKSSRDKLLEFMADWPDVERLRMLSQAELAEWYSAAIATQIWTEIATGKTRLSGRHRESVHEGAASDRE